MYGCVKSLCFVWNTVDGDGGRIWLLQLELGVHEVSRAFSISDIQRSLASMTGRVYASCVRCSLIYGNEAMPLLADVWLKFEGAAMRMIR